jgi:opacity protein-like surface antigen
LTRLCLLVFSLGIALLTLVGSAAEAQVSVYGMVGLSRYGFSYQGDSYRFKDDTASFGGGAFYNFPIHSRLTAGIDGRVLYGPASYGGTTADVALRVGFVPTRNRLRPYFEIGGGMVSSVINPGYAPQRITNGAAEFLGGLDIRLTDRVDLRAVEWGAAAGVSNNDTTSGVGFLEAGFVYHFHPPEPESKPKH